MYVYINHINFKPIHMNVLTFVFRQMLSSRGVPPNRCSPNLKKNCLKSLKTAISVKIIFELTH